MKEIKNTKFIFIILLSLVIFTKPVFANENLDKWKLLTEVLSYLQNYYVEQDKVDMDTLLLGAVSGAIKTLDDPYTRYMPPKKYSEMQIETKQEFGGLGIVVTIKDNILTIVSPIEGTPAFEKGVMPGDKIIKIEGESTKNLTLDEAVQKLRGKPQTPVTITIFRKGKEAFDVTIVRDIIEIKYVKHTWIDKDLGIGYVRLIQFGEHTAPELENALKDLTKDNLLKGLILDMRRNPGGLLTSAFDVADKFVGKDRIVYTRGRAPNSDKDYFAHKENTYNNFKLVVLVDQGTASGAEIVTGAIKDTKRGIIIGKKTFGKGVVQSVYQLQAGGAFALTTAYYYTPSGVCIHKKGIEPDIEVDPQPLDETIIKNLDKLSDTDVLMDFIKEKPDFTDTDVSDFQKKLKKDYNIDLPQDVLKYRIKYKKSQIEGKNFVVDMNLDNQLKTAYDILRAALILSKD